MVVVLESKETQVTLHNKNCRFIYIQHAVTDNIRGELFSVAFEIHLQEEKEQ
jgi:hypothetical protein